MLGGLNRLLRMLGYDTKYSSKTKDNELLSIASSENRILLTRDVELHKRAEARNIPALLVKGNTEPERLAFLARVLQISLDIDMTHTRCPECGYELRKVSKRDVTTLVPPASLEQYNEYWRCTNCEKVYWIGSHWKQIRSTLEKARELKNKQS
jgi:uncharacterized protein with PIN domain